MSHQASNIEQVVAEYFFYKKVKDRVEIKVTPILFSTKYLISTVYCYGIVDAKYWDELIAEHAGRSTSRTIMRNRFPNKKGAIV